MESKLGSSDYRASLCPSPRDAGRMKKGGGYSEEEEKATFGSIKDSGHWATPLKTSGGLRLPRLSVVRSSKPSFPMLEFN